MTEASHQVGLGCPARPLPQTLQPHNCASPLPWAHIFKGDREVWENAAWGWHRQVEEPFLIPCMPWRPIRGGGLGKLVDEKHPVVDRTPKTQLGRGLTRSYTSKASLKRRSLDSKSRWFGKGKRSKLNWEEHGLQSQWSWHDHLRTGPSEGHGFSGHLQKGLKG